MIWIQMYHHVLYRTEQGTFKRQAKWRDLGDSIRACCGSRFSLFPSRNSLLRAMQLPENAKIRTRPNRDLRDTCASKSEWFHWPNPIL